MTEGPLDELYFQWLYRQVAPIRLKNPARTYWSLLRQLHAKEFVWFVPNDDNRVMDGKDLRYGFLEAIGEDHFHHPTFMTLECSILEMLIALARRLSFNGGGASQEWFWHLMNNLGLRGCNDAEPGPPEVIDHILNRVIERTYNYDGSGGLFPLKETNVDQRSVEIWYQMTSYLIERG